MNVLALDTASPRPAIAFWTGSEALEESLPSDRRAAEEILSAVRRLLSRAGVRLEDCERLAVCSGPGSFTGVRIGLATAWGFARALGLRVETVSTLEAMAEAARRPELDEVVTALDAGRGDAVLARFSLAQPRARLLSGPERLRAVDAGRFIGSGAAAVLPPGLLAEATIPLDRSPAAALAAAAGREPRDGRPDWVLEPFYGRRSAAEEKVVTPQA
jgi:tRNA threonylcarbamoyladenosine biosynthesis protein TsaB